MNFSRMLSLGSLSKIDPASERRSSFGSDRGRNVRGGGDPSVGGVRVLRAEISRRGPPRSRGLAPRSPRRPRRRLEGSTPLFVLSFVGVNVPSAVRLVPFTSDEMTSYVAASIREYAAEHVRAGNWSPEGSEERARKEFETLLPQRESTPDQFLYSVVESAGGRRVGMVWMGLRPGAGAPQAFVFDLRIDPDHRRHGYAAAALWELEQLALGHGAQQIGLHVFEHNPGAIRLYEKLGYQTSDRLMRKPLSTASSSGP
jgi:ribosomal protein S18 acetylase RimI-like enzyme